ncbi:hypothetical protein NSQ38_15760 [Paenibacillus sp. FSL R7-0313]|uniref:hypothetical protein n=1 Tax=Paenibacillus sp. FSL R7-0313 TaxID=2954532 RepID=UPI0030D90CE3
MNEQLKDQISSFTKKAIDFLFLYNPKETSLGFLLGNVLYFLSDVFKPILSRMENILDITKMNYIGWVLFGVLITTFPEMFKKKKLDPEIEGILSYIKEAQVNGDLSKTEVRRMYRLLYEKALQGANTKEMDRNIGDSMEA